MIYPISVICTPPELIREFNKLIFQFLWNGKDTVIRRSKFAPFEQGGLQIIDNDSIITALRLSWLKRIADPEYFSFWKSYLIKYFAEERGIIVSSVQLQYEPNKTIGELLS